MTTLSIDTPSFNQPLPNTEQMTQFFKALSDPTRLKLLSLLITRDALCVCDLTQHLIQPQPTVSRHLSYLKKSGLVVSERRGTWMWYSINPDLTDWEQLIIQTLPTASNIELSCESR